MAGSSQYVSPLAGARLAPGLIPPSPFEEVTVNGFRWMIAPEHRQALLGPKGLRLEEWLKTGQACVVKKGPHRVVYRVDLPNLSFYVKRNLITDRWSRFRAMICPSKARTEYLRARGVAKRGLPTYLSLGYGEQKIFSGAGESILITSALEDTQELHTFAVSRLARMAPARQARLRHQLAIELGKLVAQMHDAGIRHNDLHPANILVRLGENDQVFLFLIDLNAVNMGAPLTWNQSRQNLVILNRWFVLRASRSDRYRFWNAYRQERQQGKGCSSLNSREGLDLADEVETCTLTSNLKFWKQRDRRCLKNNRYYCRVGSEGVVGHAVMDLDPDLLAKLQADPDEPFRRSGITVLKDSPTSTVIELDVLIDGVRHTMIYKRFRINSWTHFWTTMFRQPPALRSWVQGQGFRERGLPTARPLAVLHRRRHGLYNEGYLLTEKIENAQDLHGFLADVNQQSIDSKLPVLRGQIAQVATVLRELHRRRLSHRDLKAANVLVSRDRTTFFSPFSNKAWTTSSPSLLPIFATSVWLIDLVGVRRYHSLSRSRKVQNLARLNASFQTSNTLTLTDRLRFLRTYLRWSLHGKADWKNLWRAIDRATQVKIHRNYKRGRPLA
jgi:tRNA A-37 threonylcarbamoyl transferase component Bud32